MLSALVARTWLSACSAPPPSETLPPTASRATYDEMWADARATRTPGDGGGALAWIEAPAPVPAGHPVDLTLRLTVGPHGIAAGGVITVIPSPFWGWSPPQTAADEALGFTTLEPPAGVTLTPRDVTGMVLATVAGRALAPGEFVDIRYRGAADRFAEQAAAVWIAVDADGDGVRATLPPLTMTVRPRPARQLLAVWPSTARPGDTVTVSIAALDADGNGPAPFPSEVRLALPPALGPARVLSLVDGRATVPIEVPAPGIFVVEATASGVAPAISNPLVARADVVPILWADLQIHSAASDGTGEADALYRYARQVAGLDVAAITDHDHWGMRYLDADPQGQAAIARATDAAYAPGAFVTVHGYEWTSWAHGHRHVLWFDHARPWLSSLDPAFDTPAELHAALTGHAALVVRHHPAGGPVAIDWSFPIDPVLEPVVEIASVHGQSESPSLPGAIYDAVPAAFAERALADGARFGLIGSTDGHDGHPGLSQLAGGRGGLAAIEGAEHTRESILGALRARRVYATNGPRIVLRVAWGDTPMGGVHRGGGPIVVRAIGTAPIEHVELVSTRAGVVASRAGDGSALLFAELPVEPTAGAGLYVRVVQVDGGLAWSSPIYAE